MAENKESVPRRMRKRTKIILALLIIVLLLFGGLVAYGFYLYNKAESTVEGSYEAVERNHKDTTETPKDTSKLREEEVDPGRDSVSMLIIGIDDNDYRKFGDSSRSDTLILATFNQSNNTVKLVSIPRDTYTYVSEIDAY